MSRFSRTKKMTYMDINDRAWHDMTWLSSGLMQSSFSGEPGDISNRDLQFPAKQRPENFTNYDIYPNNTIRYCQFMVCLYISPWAMHQTVFLSQPLTLLSCQWSWETTQHVERGLQFNLLGMRLLVIRSQSMSSNVYENPAEDQVKISTFPA